jgi:hypothetical protein
MPPLYRVAGTGERGLAGSPPDVKDVLSACR